MSRIDIKKIGITQLKTEAIVNAANEHLMAGAGVCGAIFEAAGKQQLQKACDQYGYCETGKAVITDGFNLPQKYIIHAVGPIYQAGSSKVNQLLASAYTNSLLLAKQYQIHSIGFPVISAGIYGFPINEAFRIAINSCRQFINENPDYSIDITFAVIDEKKYRIGLQLLGKEVHIEKLKI